MSKNIKDYIHLYVGCEMTSRSFVGTLWCIGDTGYRVTCSQWLETDYEKYKLLLRPLSDMTDDEKDGLRHADRLATSQNILPEIRASRLTNYRFTQRSAEITRYLLSRGFDLFDLIPAGLAPNKTKATV